MTGGVVDRLRPGETVQQVNARRVPLFQLQLKPVVCREAAAIGDLDEVETRDGTTLGDREVLARVVRTRLVVVAEDHQTVRAVADIGDVEYKVARELPLDGQVPTLHVRG